MTLYKNNEAWKQESGISLEMVGTLRNGLIETGTLRMGAKHGSYQSLWEEELSAHHTHIFGQLYECEKILNVQMTLT